MTRFKAALIHLLISALIVLTLLVLMFGIWYPNEYFKLMGGDGLIYLIVGVDLCLGPLLTLVVFKSGKKSLRFDLAVIALVQISALIYGSYTMFNSRPVFTAYNDGEFSVATALEVVDEELKLATKDEWKTRSIIGPVVVGTKKPSSKKELESMSFLSGGMGYARFPKTFVSYESQSKEILQAAKPLSLLRSFSSKNSPNIDQFIKEQNRPESEFAFTPINSFFGDMAAILDAKTAAFITIIDATPHPPAVKK